MEKTRNRKNTASKKSEEQAAKTSEQQNLQQMSHDNTGTNPKKINWETVETLQTIGPPKGTEPPKVVELPQSVEKPKDKENEQDTPINPQGIKKRISPFVVSLANRIMARIYELYGYSIEGELLSEILSRAQEYANDNKIAIKTGIDKIDTHELYDYIVNIISSGYNLSPLDTTYNDIFLRAVAERYKV
jgi:transposase